MILKKNWKMAVLVLAFVAILLAAFWGITQRTDGNDKTALEADVTKTWETDTGETLTAVMARACDVDLVKTVNDSLAVVTGERTPAVVTSLENGGKNVADFYTVHISNSDGKVLYVYRMYLKGEISQDASQRQLSSVTFSRWSGDECETSAEMDQQTAQALFVHPVYGSFAVHIEMNSDGTFTVSC